MLEPTRAHVPTLDGLRGVAVLLVLWSHYSTILRDESFGRFIIECNRVLQPGALGVDLFFVLSGFLITRILYHGRCHDKPVRNFLIRRALRIFPIYYLLLLILLFAAPGEYILWCATYLSNFVFIFHGAPNPMRHSWSLCVEEHFYLVWPLIITFTPVRFLRAMTLLVAFGGIALAITAAVTADVWMLDRMVYRATPFRMTSLAAGSAFALFEPSLRIGTIRPVRLALLFFLPGPIILAIALALGPPWRGPLNLVGLTFFSCTIFLIALGARGLSSRLNDLLRGGGFAYLGRISYGLYLYHYPIFFALGMMGSDNPTSATRSALALPLTVAASVLSFHIIERPILRFSRRFR